MRNARRTYQSLLPRASCGAVRQQSRSEGLLVYGSYGVEQHDARGPTGVLGPAPPPRARPARRCGVGTWANGTCRGSVGGLGSFKSWHDALLLHAPGDAARDTTAAVRASALGLRTGFGSGRSPPAKTECNRCRASSRRLAMSFFTANNASVLSSAPAPTALSPSAKGPGPRATAAQASSWSSGAPWPPGRPRTVQASRQVAAGAPVGEPSASR